MAEKLVHATVDRLRSDASSVGRAVRNGVVNPVLGGGAKVVSFGLGAADYVSGRIVGSIRDAARELKQTDTTVEYALGKGPITQLRNLVEVTRHQNYDAIAGTELSKHMAKEANRALDRALLTAAYEHDKDLALDDPNRVLSTEISSEDPAQLSEFQAVAQEYAHANEIKALLTSTYGNGRRRSGKQETLIEHVYRIVDSMTLNVADAIQVETGSMRSSPNESLAAALKQFGRLDDEQIAKLANLLDTLNDDRKLLVRMFNLSEDDGLSDRENQIYDALSVSSNGRDVARRRVQAIAENIGEEYRSSNNAKIYGDNADTSATAANGALGLSAYGLVASHVVPEVVTHFGLPPGVVDWFDGLLATYGGEIPALSKVSLPGLLGGIAAAISANATVDLLATSAASFGVKMGVKIGADQIQRRVLELGTTLRDRHLSRLLKEQLTENTF